MMDDVHQRASHGAARKEGNVKSASAISLLIAVCLAAGCVSRVTHEDSPAAVNRDEGPTLCRDGTTPPCNTRD